MIYFLACETAIKIGFTNRGTLDSVQSRVRSCETGNPFPINILAAMPGNQSVEFGLHRQFDDARIRGEWFRKTPELVDFIRDNGVSEEKFDERCVSCPTCLVRFLPNQGEDFCSSHCQYRRLCVVCGHEFSWSRKHPNICSADCQRKFNSTLSAAQISR
jgi:hypothetical protein